MTAPTKRRWFQFSLRTLFVVVTVLAVALGLTVWVLRNRQIKAEREELLTHYGVVPYVPGNPADTETYWQRFRHPRSKLPIGLWLVGAGVLSEIMLIDSEGHLFTEDEHQHFQKMFPEVEITWSRHPPAP